MLPNKVLQFDYEDISHLVETHIDNIIDYEHRNSIKFDTVLAKLRNGTVPGTIVANRFQISMSVIEMPRNISIKNFRLFLSYEIEEKLNCGEKINILFIDGICGTGKTIDYVEEFFKSHPKKDQINIVSYCTFVDASAKTKPNIIGLEVYDRFFQPPWEWRSFTPQAHLDRLEIGHIKASQEQECCVGFDSDKTALLIKNYFNKEHDFDWTMIFSNNEGYINHSYSIDYSLKKSLSDTIQEQSHIVEQKVNFIEQNGLTHFIETDLNQALLIAQICPVCHVIYFENDNLLRIFSKKINSNDFQQ